MVLPITLTIAGAAAILNIWLAIRCVTVRLRGKVLIGDGGDPVLVARMRSHANFVEYAPFVLILSGLIEYAGGSPTLLWAAGAAFILGRLLHPFGLDRGDANVFRGLGVLLTVVPLLTLAIYALYIPYSMH